MLTPRLWIVPPLFVVDMPGAVRVQEYPKVWRHGIPERFRSHPPTMKAGPLVNIDQAVPEASESLSADYKRDDNAVVVQADAVQNCFFWVSASQLSRFFSSARP